MSGFVTVSALLDDADRLFASCTLENEEEATGLQGNSLKLQWLFSLGESDDRDAPDLFAPLLSSCLCSLSFLTLSASFLSFVDEDDTTEPQEECLRLP